MCLTNGYKLGVTAIEIIGGVYFIKQQVEGKFLFGSSHIHKHVKVRATTQMHISINGI